MCRWPADIGNPVYLDELLFKPEHSLIDQSLSAGRSTFTTNGDDFGLRWYSSRKTPGLYNNVRPAWHERGVGPHTSGNRHHRRERRGEGTAVSPGLKRVPSRSAIAVASEVPQGRAARPDD